jgi:hypothetical protein
MPRDRSDITSALKRKGFKEKKGESDHDVYVLVYQGERQAVFTKVSRGSGYKTIGDELLSKMSKQLRLTNKQFRELVDCPMSQDD